MKYQILKAWKDVTEGKGKSLLVIFALALGLWGLGSVAVSWSVLSRDLKGNFLGTSPVHAIFTLKEKDDSILDTLKARGEIESAEFRDLKMLRVEVYPDSWIPLWLFGVGDFENMALAKIVSESGAHKPSRGSILIERDGLLISALTISSVASVRNGARNIEVPVEGIVFDPALPPATQDHFIYAYTDMETFSTLSGAESGKRLIVRFRDVNSRSEVEAAVAKLMADSGSGGIANSTVEVRPFLEHPHQWQLDMLLAIIGIIGLLAFLLSSILVGQVVAALVAKQIRQIGILKAIGGTRARIAGIFSVYLLFYALISGLIAIPLAISTGYAFSYFCAGILNFNILTTSLPAEVFALLIVSALVLPFLFAFPTLIKAGRVSVREALGETPFRHRTRVTGRVVVTALATALGVAIFSSGFNLRQSLSNFLTSTGDSMRYDIQVVLTKPVPESEFLEPFESISGIERIEAWTGGRGELQTSLAGTDDGIGIVALPLDSRVMAMKMAQGHWFESASDPEVVLNQAAVELFHQPIIGQTLSVGIAGVSRQMKLVGIAEEIDRPKIYINDAFYDRWANPAHLVNTLMITARDGEYQGVMALKKEIERAVKASSLSVLDVMSQAERVKIIADHLNIILIALLLLAFLVLSVSALGMASATSITVMERTREIGVLRAIGATPRKIIKIFLMEGMATSGAGLILGLILSWPLSLAASVLFGAIMFGEGVVLRYAFSPAGFWITIAATAVFGFLASRIPAGGAIGLSTREALAYE
ncbi:MAG: hypothetical protein A2087_10900 [Spirochaetes bacterium GWD1_61_31]|nr:MAG: hypothetical protein A2Y37_06935 [Spirochaetes bacterium GWB1_60_80]OHD36400.1 MAG: hypothetical protein A2087_10900 [Spirochaetes bacterium GWD1_61_31]OHD46309.1 MAG: hypothetical protein A2Y35_07210 [Spirochaetes bacterium GWE1_60_18]OHD60916.1 MAG: hypothetical protein A2Y32_11955 [Spirochaetes bacterium GWF1_60_12]